MIGTAAVLAAGKTFAGKKVADALFKQVGGWITDARATKKTAKAMAVAMDGAAQEAAATAPALAVDFFDEDFIASVLLPEVERLANPALVADLVTIAAKFEEHFIPCATGRAAAYAEISREGRPQLEALTATFFDAVVKAFAASPLLRDRWQHRILGDVHRGVAANGTTLQQVADDVSAMARTLRAPQPVRWRGPPLEVELQRQRSARFYAELQDVAEARTMAAAILAGDFADAMAEQRAEALLYVARVVADEDLDAAHAFAASAKAMSPTIDDRTTRSKFALLAGDVDAAVQCLGVLNTPLLRTQALMVISIGGSPADMLEWFEAKAFAAEALTGAGLLLVAKAYADRGAWAEAEALLDQRSATQLTDAPPLRELSAACIVAAIVQPEFHATLLANSIPPDPKLVLRRSDTSLLDRLQRASTLYGEAVDAPRAVGAVAYADILLRLSLWLRLEHPDLAAGATAELARLLATTARCRFCRWRWPTACPSTARERKRRCGPRRSLAAMKPMISTWRSCSMIPPNCMRGSSGAGPTSKSCSVRSIS